LVITREFRRRITWYVRVNASSAHARYPSVCYLREVRLIVMLSWHELLTCTPFPPLHKDFSSKQLPVHGQPYAELAI